MNGLHVSLTNFRVALIICSVGRPQAIADVLPWIRRQTLAPSEVLLVVTKEADLPPPDVLSQIDGLEVIYSEKGLPRQRNRGLEAVVGRSDAIFFIDDDYLPARDAIEGIARAFQAYPEASGLTGALLADGIHNGGVPLDAAEKMILADEEARSQTPSEPRALKRDLVGLYGCNMAYRSSAIGDNLFDERLPLYGWQEDVDFASRVPGVNLKVDSIVGIHCGTRNGRETSGVLLGYSQVANVVYLWRKGSLPTKFAFGLILRNVLSNHAKMFRPEDWISRSDRARGNRIAFLDLLKGRAAPERILELTAK